MRFETRLYKYDSNKEADNYRGEDFSIYILQGDSDVDDLTEVLDVVNLTLVDLPFAKEFSPLTKFIYEKWQYIESGTNKAVNKASNKEIELVMYKDWHLCVAEDVVSQPVISDNTKFDHAITFNEASVDAQKRIVDNIAVTYKLQDVTLEETPTYNVDQSATSTLHHYSIINQPVGWIFSTGFEEFIKYQFNWDWNSNGGTNAWANFKYNQILDKGVAEKTIEILIPDLACYKPNGATSFQKAGYCSVIVTVAETNKISGALGNTTSKQIDVSSSSSWVDGYVFTRECMIGETGFLPKGYIVSSYLTSDIKVKKIAQYTSNSDSYTHKVSVTIRPGYVYTVNVVPVNFKTDLSENIQNPNYELQHYIHDNNNNINGYFHGDIMILDTHYLNFDNPDDGYSESGFNPKTDSSCFAELVFECVAEEGSNTISSLSAEPYNAYDLYNKAMLSTQNFRKQAGVPIDETPKAYYLSESDIQRLRTTKIVENFYSQKNWWELQLDIGKFMHCIPKVRFGSDDRFVTTWKQLGDTKKLDDNGKKISIFNSRQVDEYVASVSSYVSNIVQLGGIIDEWVAPKSSSGDYLVYNDVAEIHTSRPIIEIVDMQVKCIKAVAGITLNATRNLTGNGTNQESKNGYIFAKEIYQTLEISPKTLPNKGLAIWYSLGDNKIQGLNYSLPTSSGLDVAKGEGEYAIKRIIGDAFKTTEANIKNIKINNFVFHIVYRTKDTLRTLQSRPDIRKYLKTSKYDKVPQAMQFTNQQDTVVDSVKFGNNTYGMLIRTGNTNYTVTEWHDSLFTLKSAGELYQVRDDELFYVSKVKNTYYANHIISEVEYSKDFNRLSQIIGIPSEPRFYEISEQSQIKREVSIDDYILVGTSFYNTNNNNSYVQSNGWSWIAQLLFGDMTEYPKYAVTVFKNDADKENIEDNENFYTEVCHAIGAYSIQNILTLSWGMEDNFSAGTMVNATTASFSGGDAVNTAYATLEQFRYTDIFGRADLFEFFIINKFSISNSAVPQLPTNSINVIDNISQYLFGSCGANDLNNITSHQHGMGLLKDNREAIHFNYNLQAITDSDRFVLSAYFWQDNKQNLKIALLSQEVNKISVSTIPVSVIMQTYDFDTTTTDGIKINVSKALNNVSSTTLDTVASIAIISNNIIDDVENHNSRYFVLARNVSDLNNDQKIADWFVGYIDKNIFEHQ